MKLFFLFSLLQLNIYAITENYVAEVTLLSGDVRARLINGKVITLSKDQQIPEGALIKTFDKSFIKVTFIDQSTTTLGPNSIIKIDSYAKDDSGILYLYRGQMRSQVTKDYMNIEDKNKSKLFIRTKSAAMGIRGTDFQVNYDHKTEATSLVTFEGKVAMNKIEKSEREREFNQKSLESLLERKERIMVEAGKISFINRELQDRPLKTHRIEEQVEKELKNVDVPREKVVEVVEKIVEKITIERVKEPNPIKIEKNDVEKNIKPDVKMDIKSDGKVEEKIDLKNDIPLDEKGVKEIIKDVIKEEKKEVVKEEKKEERKEEKKEERKEEKKEERKEEKKEERKEEKKEERKEEKKEERKIDRKDDRKNERRDDKKDERRDIKREDLNVSMPRKI